MYLSPLSIQFIWHPEDKETVFPIVEYCKQKLSRNPDNSFLHSLDFPIFCYTSKNDDLPPEINTMAEKLLLSEAVLLHLTSGQNTCPRSKRNTE